MTVEGFEPWTWTPKPALFLSLYVSQPWLFIRTTQAAFRGQDFQWRDMIFLSCTKTEGAFSWVAHSFLSEEEVDEHLPCCLEWKLSSVLNWLIRWHVGRCRGRAWPIATGLSLSTTTSKPGSENLHGFCRNAFKPEDEILIYISPPLTFHFDKLVLSSNYGHNAMKYYGRHFRELRFLVLKKSTI